MSAQPQPRDIDPKLRLMNGELWLARRLGLRGVLIVFDGITDVTERKRRMRQAIRDRALTDVRVKLDGPLTYAGAFHRLYGEAL
jgi:hypothetical protein